MRVKAYRRDPDQLLTPGQLSALTGISERQLREWRASPGAPPLPFIKITARTVRYRRGDVEAFIRACRQGPSPERLLAGE